MKASPSRRPKSQCQLYLVPSGSLRSKEVLRGMAAWACCSSCWHCSRSGVPGAGEALGRGCRAGVGTRCHVVFLRKGVLYSQGVPSLSSLYSTMGMRQSSEHPLWRQEETVRQEARTIRSASVWPHVLVRLTPGGGAVVSGEQLAYNKQHVLTIQVLGRLRSLSLGTNSALCCQPGCRASPMWERWLHGDSNSEMNSKG